LPGLRIIRGSKRFLRSRWRWMLSAVSSRGRNCFLSAPITASGAIRTSLAPPCRQIMPIASISLAMISGSPSTSIRKNNFHIENIIPGGSVLEAGGTAGVRGGIAADGTGVEACRVGRVEEPPGPDRLLEIQGQDARLCLGGHVVRFNGEDPIHGGQRKDHAAQDGNSAACAPRAQAPGRDGEAVATGQFHQLPDLGR